MLGKSRMAIYEPKLVLLERKVIESNRRYEVENYRDKCRPKSSTSNLGHPLSQPDLA